ncbi:MAG: glutamate racemase [Sphingobacteriales bacterium SCN 48-20]|jgi:glutamate racemase|uniref:glutamate racemase n=1 Tax=Terrimonas ferruginea TaxID=249 RepID=UPI00086A9E5F|nr:glutamate racemase [Terrimonas ferruginea]MBN8782090.1 glutamate racemase [Terrimonas ferruginea]ODT91640.1 MAG: glutamate racemase [Sphingobacteriales bacterium SCN 48-20]OJW42638.1 MAG: glutamate racemase [Sphingobacteriales bacterium 48-107]
MSGPIGVFDSGYGGLTVLRELVNRLPGYDYLYLGDNARAPYGNRSFETVYEYTLQCVRWFFDQGCPLVILACNTASAKALRTIQQKDLPQLAPDRRVLGVIRPTTELIGKFSHTGSVGILATNGTVASGSYPVEINRFFPDLKVYQEACPMWVPLVENGEYKSAGADFFIRKNLDNLFSKGSDIDTVLLACTHYPLLREKIQAALPEGIQLLSQGQIVAESLADYLQRHPEIEERCRRGNDREFYTTDSPEDFDNHATAFFGEAVRSERCQL